MTLKDDLLRAAEIIVSCSDLALGFPHAKEYADLASRLRAAADEQRWLAFDVGCIECGEESAVVGIFSTKEQAEAAAQLAREEQKKNWSGQHSFEVFDISAMLSAAPGGKDGK